MKLITLDAAAAKSFDKFLKAKEQCQKLSKATGDRKTHQAAVVKAMGDAMRAKLPDGRIVQRLPKTRKMSAKPAHEQLWEELVEAAE